ncbi:MAG: hypothetical protein E7536_05110 [Ruminococcaceae bacterium]|nr:hypothetical protein [Oscillospiraceae bacterium]
MISIAIFTVVAVVASAIIIPKILNKQIQEENPFKNVVSISTGGSIAGLRKDGTVVVVGNEEMKSYVENWTDITAISVGSYHIVGLRKDGTVVSTPALTEQDCYRSGQDAVSDWTDIVEISATDFTIVGLKKDGTVLVYEWDEMDESKEYCYS